MEPEIVDIADIISVKSVGALLKAWKKLRDKRRTELEELRRELQVDYNSLFESYVFPDCQLIPHYSERRSKFRVSAFSHLNEFLCSESSTELGAGSEHQFILAGAGMGKTSLLTMICLRFLWKNPGRFTAKAFKLGPDTIERLKQIEFPSDCILLLDSLDEDPTGWENIEDRLVELIEATKCFYRVVITCRTQFFPVHIEAGGEVVVAGYRCPAAYLSVFTDEQVKRYVYERWHGKMEWWSRKLPLSRKLNYVNKKVETNRLATQLCELMGELSSRPLLLAYLQDIITARSEERDDPIKAESEFTLFRWLVKGWLLREQRKIRKERKIEPEYWKKLLHGCTLVSGHMNTRGRRDIRVLGKDEFETLRALNDDIRDVKKIDMLGRSLLIKDADDNLRFAHFSIQEYLVVEGVLANHFQNLLEPGETFVTTKKMLRFLSQAPRLAPGISVTQLCFERKCLADLNLTGLDFSSASFRDSDLSRADFSDSQLSSGALCDAESLCGIVLDRVVFENESFRKLNFEDASFREGLLRDSQFEFCRLSRANFSGSKCLQLSFLNTDLTASQFNDAVLVNIAFIDTPLKEMGFQRSTFNGLGSAGEPKELDLSGQLFSDCDFANACLNTVKLEYAKFDQCNLTSADLEYAKLKGARFVSCDLSGATFEAASIEETEFIDCVLDRVNFSDAPVELARFTRCWCNYLTHYYTERVKILTAENQIRAAESLLEPLEKNEAIPNEVWLSLQSAIEKAKSRERALLSEQESEQLATEDLARLKSRAEAYLASGHIGAATKIFESIIERYPGHPLALKGLCLCMMRLDKPKKGLQIIRRLTASKDADASSWRIQGQCQVSAGQLSLSISSFDKAIALDSKDPRNWGARGRAYQKLGEEQKAKLDFQKAGGLSSQNYDGTLD